MNAAQREALLIIAAVAIAVFVGVSVAIHDDPGQARDATPSPVGEVYSASSWALYCPGEIVRVGETGDIFLRRLDVACPEGGSQGIVRVSAQQCDTIGEVLAVLERTKIKCQVVPWRATPHAIAVPTVR